MAAKPEPAAAADSEEEDEDGGQRRSRRNRRGRSRNRAEAEAASGEAGGSEEADEAAETADESAGEKDGVTSRRRRRRRRGDARIWNSPAAPRTIRPTRSPASGHRARWPRPPVNNRVTIGQGLHPAGGQEAAPPRIPRAPAAAATVITEAEFLARRESVDRQMIVRQRDDRIQIGVLEDGVLAEHFVSKTQQDSLIGNVYLGKVQNVLPSMEAAFVDIGRGRNAVLYAGEVNWDAVNLEGKQRRIENALKSGDSVLVQVTKDPVGHKGARLTSQISLPGRYLVYVPGGSMTGISRKLPDVERNRLKRILKDRLPEDAGVIVRTAAEGASEEELTHDINRLRAQWEGIESQSDVHQDPGPGTALRRTGPDHQGGPRRLQRGLLQADRLRRGSLGHHRGLRHLRGPGPGGPAGEVDQGRRTSSPPGGIDEQIHKALDRKVFLPSGGSLVIDRTEAMTVVDVNTGKFTGSGGNLEETVTKNNLEAAEEVVRQLRLRDIGGIIVIDFIDMVLESNRDLVLRRMVECLGRDRTKHQVAEVTSLGLVQMTRKRMGTGLLEVFGEQCEACAGRGIVTHDEPVEHRRANTVDRAPPGAADREAFGAGSPAASASAAAAARASQESRRRGAGSRGAAEDDAERQAKAEATRAALANIAAAAHAAHEAEEHPEAAKAKQHDGEPAHAAGGAGKPDVAAATAPAQGQPAASGRKRRSRRADDSGIAAPVATPSAAAGEDGGAGVLKINGETVRHSARHARSGGRPGGAGADPGEPDRGVQQGCPGGEAGADRPGGRTGTGRGSSVGSPVHGRRAVGSGGPGPARGRRAAGSGRGPGPQAAPPSCRQQPAGCGGRPGGDRGCLRSPRRATAATGTPRPRRQRPPWPRRPQERPKLPLRWCWAWECPPRSCSSQVQDRPRTLLVRGLCCTRRVAERKCTRPGLTAVVLLGATERIQSARAR